MNRLLIFFASLIFIFSCQRNSEPQELNAGNIEKYLSEYSPERISIKDPIILRFNQSITLAKSVSENVIHFKPEIKGKVEWLDQQTLSFTPDQTLDYNKKYLATIEINDLFPESGKDEKLTLLFETKKLEFDLDVSKDLNYSEESASLTGVIRSSDIASDKIIEGLISTDRSKHDIDWNHSSDRRSHTFIIKNIIREEAPSSITLSWNGNSYDKTFVGERSFAIATKGLFEVTGINVPGSSKSIEVHFSDLVDPSQQLSGLIKIDGYKGILKFDIEGSLITVFPSKEIVDNAAIKILPGIKSEKGKKLSKEKSAIISFAPAVPEIRVIGKGVITPFENAIIFPFEAKGLNTVDVEIFKIFSDNILQYLQNNSLNQRAYYLESVGRIIHQEKVDLANLASNPDYNKWTRYALDLRQIVNIDPASFYIVRVGFRRAYTDYPCQKGEINEGPLLIEEPFKSILRWNSSYEGYIYSQERDPCYPVYYNENRFIQKNLLASNLGLIAKGSPNNKYHVEVRDLLSLDAEEGVDISMFDYQKQLIASGKTSKEGLIKFELDRKASFITAKNGREYGYLSIKDEAANSLSDFEVSGSKKEKGLDGFLYGERGVWRPGDSIYLTFILEDPLSSIPRGHPIDLALKDARGALKYQKIASINESNMYVYKIPTDITDPTGTWRAKVTVGDQVFAKSLKIETVKPNRLKVELELPQEISLSENNSLPFSSSWLHGTPAANLKARVEATYSSYPTSFSNYKDFVFDDPARKLRTTSSTIFDKKLDAEGIGVLALNANKDFLPPGKVKVALKTRIFEPTGEFTEDNVSTLASPYTSYVGIKIPESRWGSKMISKESGEGVSIVVVDEEGNPVKNRSISLGLYEAEWNWWYNRSNSNIYRYDEANHLEAVEKKTIVTDANGRAQWKPEDLPDYRYLIRACDDESGHCTGDLFYTPYYDYQSNDGAASILKLKSDKEKYAVGDQITLSVPSNLQSKIFVTVENGKGLVEEYWFDGNKEVTEVKIPTNNLMAPNVYIHTMLIQKYRNGSNDLPLRMYGVLPLQVEDPDSRIYPVLDAPQEIRPKQNYTVEVEEKDGKEMYYTLAVVDEGLLGLTRFKTTNLWDHFYAKQSLGVKTWDLYDMVLNGYGGEIDKYISIGGDAGSLIAPEGRQANRFKPVVDFLGPFKLSKKGKNKHALTMDNYMGAVRVMVVARSGSAYGKAEKSIPVSNPLMVLPTVPRTISPKETFLLPINVFVNKAEIKKVTVSIELGPGMSASTDNQILTFDRPGDQMLPFSVQVDNYQGPSYIIVKASGNGEKVDQRIEIQIQNPNPRIKESKEYVLKQGETKEISYEGVGVPGSQEGEIEVSTFPAIKLQQRLDYLIRYPYGCVEQTTSSVFPQLYLDHVMELSATEKLNIEKNIRAGIKRLSKFQLASGGLAYWKGSSSPSDWGTSYGGHFLIEAKTLGYFVPSSLIDNWVTYQKKQAKAWGNGSNYSYQNLMQAYRLYTLAKSGNPEWGEMNRLKNVKIDATTTFTLAAAYAASGKNSIANELISGVPFNIEAYVERGYTYGSDLRDKSLIVEAMLNNNFGLNNTALTAKVLEIARDLGSQNWYSTQTTAFGLLAVGKYLKQNKPGVLDVTYYVDSGNKENIKSDLAIASRKLDIKYGTKHTASITNNSNGTLYVTINLSGQADYNEMPAVSSNLKMNVRYTDLKGNLIDVSNLSQGTDFIAEVTITNPGTRAYKLEEMALTQVFPSGWEILNDRISGNASEVQSDRFEYQDIKDDRVNTFFDMEKKKVFRQKLSATYSGQYYLPDIQCEAMYDHQILNRIPGKWITVTNNEIR